MHGYNNNVDGEESMAYNGKEGELMQLRPEEVV